MCFRVPYVWTPTPQHLEKKRNPHDNLPSPQADCNNKRPPVSGASEAQEEGRVMIPLAHPLNQVTLNDQILQIHTSYMVEDKWQIQYAFGRPLNIF